MNELPTFRNALLLSLLLCMAGVGIAQEVSPLESLSTEAYLSLRDGDLFLEDGNTEQALTKYRESQQQYLAIRQQDESFKPKIVSYRLEILEEKISSLAPQPTPSPSEVDTEHVPALPREPEDFQALYLQAREQLAQETTRLALLESRMIEADSLVRDARQKLRAQTEELRQVRQELLALQEDSGGKMSALEQESRDIARFNELLKERADTVEAVNLELSTARAELAGKVADQQTELEELTAKLEAVSQELTERKRNASQAEQQLILERNQLRDDKAELVRQLEETQESMTVMKERVADMGLLEESVIELNNRNEALLEQVETLTTTKSTSEKQVTDLQLEVQNLRERIEPLTSELATQKERADALEQSVIRSSETEAATVKLQETLQNETADLQKRLGVLALAVQEKDAFIAKLQEEHSAAQKAAESAEKEAEKSMRIRKEAERVIGEAEAERSVIRNKVKDLEKENARLEKERAELAETLSKTSEKLQALESAAQNQNEQERLTRKQSKDLETYQARTAKMEKAISLLTTERERLELNLKQEREGRQQLKKTVDQQLDAITDRMNEIISLRVKLANAEKDIERLEQAVAN